jgi:hypothetical protein
MNEDLDIKNILEVEKIKEILSPQPRLLEIFNYIIMIANKNINAESPCVYLPLEVNTEPNLSDHSSDSDHD